MSQSTAIPMPVILIGIVVFSVLVGMAVAAADRAGERIRRRQLDRYDHRLSLRSRPQEDTCD